MTLSENLEISIGLEIHKQISTLDLEFIGKKHELIKKYFKSFGNNNFYNFSKKRPIKVKVKRNEKIFNSFIEKTNNYAFYEDDFYKLDELPPVLNNNILQKSKALAKILNLELNNKSFIMRKHIYDGSIPAGFQRTLLITKPNQNTILFNLPIREIYLEEDSGQLCSNYFDLNRCAIGLFQIVTSPINIKLSELFKIVDNLKKLNKFIDEKLNLNTFQRSVRQDINFMYKNSLIEIKGLEKIIDLPKLIKTEIGRIDNLILEINKYNFKERRVNKIKSPYLYADILQYSLINKCSFKILEEELLYSPELYRLLENYKSLNFTSTRGVKNDKFTEFKRLKQGKTRMHVETDLDPIVWNNIQDYQAIDYSLEYFNLGLKENVRFPKNEKLLHFFKNNSINKSLLNFLNSNFDNLIEKNEDIFEILQLILKKFENNVLDLSYLQTHIDNCNLFKKLEKISEKNLMKLILKFKKEKLTIKDIFNKYKVLISSKKFLLENMEIIKSSD